MSLSVLLLELGLTRIFSIILWYDYAFMAISIAFFGLGIGSIIAHIIKTKLRRENIPAFVLKSSLGFAIAVAMFLFITSYLIPPSVNYLQFFYIASSMPFFFAGITISLIFYARPKEISRLYFVDLIGAAAAAILLEPLITEFGAESMLIFISLLVAVTCLLGIFIILPRRDFQKTKALNKSSIKQSLVKLLIPSYRKGLSGDEKLEKTRESDIGYRTRERHLMRLLAITSGMILVFSLVLTLNSYHTNLITIKPGDKKGLYYQLSNETNFQHLSTEWNSFSRIDVTRQINNFNSNPNQDRAGRSHALAAIAIDADADTPVIRWNGTSQDLEWIKGYMDFLPYEISEPNSTLVIGSGGGEDVLTSLVGGSENITAVELNPLIIKAAKQFGSSAGNLYDHNNVNLVIDEGRRYISGSNSKFDLIMVKLVDSWAAQLAGGYALSENYLYTVEAFKQYFEHLDENNGMLVMVRWNIELPRLMTLIYKSLREVSDDQRKALDDIHTVTHSTNATITNANGNKMQDVLNRVIAVENKPGLYFLPNSEGRIYPVLVMVKSTAFTLQELEKVKQRAIERNARMIVLPGSYVEPQYNEILSGNSSQSSLLKAGYINTSFGLPPPTDDSPFFFAKDMIPLQLITLLTTVLILSALLFLFLLYYSKLNKIDTIRTISSNRYYLLFATCIGLGFIFFEITLIQKFLLALGTPVLSLTVIVFSILVAMGLGSYASGKLFRVRPDRGILTSIPLIVVLALIYYFYLDDVIYKSIVLTIYERISLTVIFLVPLGFLMGFQFPSIIRMSLGYKWKKKDEHESALRYEDDVTWGTVSLESADSFNDHSITLIWGINIIASVIGSILTVISSMILGLSNTFLLGLLFYIAAFGLILFKLYSDRYRRI
jgi:spermidine synthase